MQYAWQVEAAGKRRIELATNRSMGFLQVPLDFRFRFSLGPAARPTR